MVVRKFSQAPACWQNKIIHQISVVVVGDDCFLFVVLLLFFFWHQKVENLSRGVFETWTIIGRKWKLILARLNANVPTLRSSIVSLFAIQTKLCVPKCCYERKKWEPLTSDCRPPLNNVCAQAPRLYFGHRLHRQWWTK